MSGERPDWLGRVGEHPMLRRRPAAAHAVALALVALALGVRLALADKMVGVPYITFYSVIAISAFVGGWKAGLTASVFSVLGALYFFIPPLYSFKLSTLSDALSMAAFALTAA